MTRAETVEAFLRVSFGSGSGSGYGDGSGSGSGYGYGSGDGSGSGYGDGDGYGYGSVDGSGSGSGYGYGYGYGYGSGAGSSYGYGDSYYGFTKSVNGETVHMIDSVQTIIRAVHGNIARGAVLNLDLTTEPCYIAKQGNLFAHGRTLHEAMEALRDKLFDDMPENERIEAFLTETDRSREYPVQYFYDWHHRLTGSCDMGRRQFAREHGIDLAKDTMTLDKFLELTKDAYGRDVIRKVLARVRSAASA